jgi:[protein-PII] uridylyltransferase
LEVARRAASTFDGHLTVSERESVTRQVATSWTHGDRKALLEILAAGRNGWTAFAGLWEAGWVDRAFPELSHLAGLPQWAPFHTHPVDAHLGRTVVEVVDFAAGADPWLAGLCDELGSLDELLLAAWLHDAGKGLGGDHSLGGSALAEKLLTRLGFPASTTSLVTKAVRHHLLLPQYAMRADPSDPLVVATVADVVGDYHTLALLAVLAGADARATGPDAWNPWRRELLRGLVGRVGQQLAGASPGALERDWRRRLEDLLDGIADPDRVDAHLERMPPGYLLRVGPDLAAQHLRLITPPPPTGETRSMIEPAEVVSTVIAAATDRPGLLSTIAGVLTLHNFSVLEARVTTRSDGMAIDTFRVIDVLGEDTVDETRWQALRDDLGAAAGGGPDLRRRLSSKEASYRTGSTRPAASAEVWEEGPLLMLEVHAPDRLGLLHAITDALARHGVEVDLAKIETRAGEAIDTFTLHQANTSLTKQELVAVVRRAADGINL